MASILIEHGTVITMDAERRIIENGAVAIEADRIVDVDTTENVRVRHSGAKVIDASRKVVMPGLIDTHGHAGHGLVKTVGDHLTGFGWRTLVDHIYFRSASEDFWYAEGLLSAVERLKFGVTCGISMMGSAPRGDDPKYTGQQARAVAEVGIRGIIGVGPPRPPWPQEFCHWRNGKREDRSVTLEESWAATEEAISSWHHSADGRVQVWASVSNLIAPSPNDPMYRSENARYAEIYCRELRRIANQHKTGIHTHAYGPTIKHTHEISDLLGPDVVLAHCTGIAEEEMQILKDTGAHVAHCPRARRIYSFNARCPVPELIDLGVNVALGTDGSSPDRSFDEFEDLKMAMTLQRLHFKDPWLMPPGKVLEMATIDAAHAVGQADQIGSLEVGKKADLILVNLWKPHLVPNFMSVHRVVYEATGHDVDAVIVDGKLLMEERQVLSVDESEVLSFAQREAEQAIEISGAEPFMQMPERFWGHSRY
jgi:cytosine/adenosine deaminase-related metal-dependent hydrolase